MNICVHKSLHSCLIISSSYSPVTKLPMWLGMHFFFLKRFEAYCQTMLLSATFNKLILPVSQLLTGTKLVICENCLQSCGSCSDHEHMDLLKSPWKNKWINVDSEIRKWLSYKTNLPNIMVHTLLYFSPSFQTSQINWDCFFG